MVLGQLKFALVSFYLILIGGFILIVHSKTLPCKENVLECGVTLAAISILNYIYYKLERTYSKKQPGHQCYSAMGIKLKKSMNLHSGSSSCVVLLPLLRCHNTLSSCTVRGIILYYTYLDELMPPSAIYMSKTVM